MAEAGISFLVLRSSLPCLFGDSLATAPVKKSSTFGGAKAMVWAAFCWWALERSSRSGVFGVKAWATVLSHAASR